MGQNNSRRKQSYQVQPLKPNTKSKQRNINNNATTSVEKTTLKAEQNNKPIEQSALVPAWVKPENFHDILQECVENYDKIIQFNAQPALTAGENYATLMLRVTIEAQLKDKSSKEISFMLKVPHDTDQMKQMLKIYNFFISENGMYFDVIPELEQMYKAKGLDVCFAAKAYKFKNDIDSPSVLLQDLRPLGFQNANRLECLNMEHCKCVLKKLAQLHAASATRVRNQGPYSKIFMEGVADLNNPAVTDFFIGMFKSFSTALNNNIKLLKDYELYEPLLKDCFERVTDELLHLKDSNINEFCVLNHGDCWSNNILFKYAADGSIEETYLVDYQNSKFGTPAQDLLYFIFSSANIEIKLSKFDYMIRYYHEHLVEHLKLLEYSFPMPKLSDLHTQLLKNSNWALTASLLVLPVVLLDPTDKANCENFMSDSSDGMEFKNMFYRNIRYIRYIDEILPWLYDRAYLEIKPKPAATASKKVNPVPATEESKSKAATDGEVKIVESTKSSPRTPIPDWVTTEYFIDILRANVPGFMQINQFNVKPGTSAGDNYASSMLAIDIEVQLEDLSTKQLSYMLKVGLASQQADALLSLFDVFDKEALMYENIIPAFENLYRKAGIDIQFGPKYYKFVKDPGYKTILLENLRPLGFKNADRLNGLDMEHTKAMLKKIAEFHAVSAQYYQLFSSYPVILMKGMFSEENRENMKPMMDSFYSIFLDIVKTYEGSETYLDKIIACNGRFYDIMISTNAVYDNFFNVLNHGDCWTNNFLFQYDEQGKIANTCFVDYQMSKYGSAAQDLYYFLCSSPQLQIKVDSFDYCIKIYHDHLCKNLKLLKYAGHVPNLKDFHIELMKQGNWALTTITGVMAVVLLDPTEDASLDVWMNDDEAGIALKKQLYTNNRYRKHATAQLLWCDKRGLLDFDIKSETPSQPVMKVPTWLNEATFAAVVAETVENFAKIVKINAAPATKPGDNYASLILRINIEAELQDASRKDLAYILKVPAADVFAKEMDVIHGLFFPKETSMYSQYLPAFERLYAESGHSVKFAPKCWQFKENVDSEYVLMEDLQKRAFKIGNRLEGLDLEHSKCVLRKMAQFHAASVRYRELHGEYPECFNASIYKEEARNILMAMMSSSKGAFEDAVKDYKECQDFVDKLLIVNEVSVDKLIELSKSDAKEFNVLNHGDSWINNIMFQYDEAGNINETLYVDFQVCQYGSPAHDLYYFLLSSTQLNIKIDKIDYLIKYYHDNLVESLQVLQYSGAAVPTLKELHAIMIRYGFLGVAHSIGIAAMVLLEPTDNLSIDQLVAENQTGKDMRQQMFGSERFKAHANVVFPWLNKRGFLDV